MTLSDLLPKLAKNDDKQICLKNSESQTIVTFNPNGYSAISAELNARTVKDIIILDSSNLIIIYLEDQENNIPLDPDMLSGSTP